MAKKQTNRLKPLMSTLVEMAVDDALESAEQFPGKKRTRLGQKASRRILDEQAPKSKRRKRKPKLKRRSR